MKDNKFGALVKEIRMEWGWNLSEVAETTALSMTFWSDIERGKRLPSFNVVKDFCTYMELSREQSAKLMGTYLEVRCETCKHKRLVEGFLAEI